MSFFSNPGQKKPEIGSNLLQNNSNGMGNNQTNNTGSSLFSNMGGNQINQSQSGMGMNQNRGGLLGSTNTFSNPMGSNNAFGFSNTPSTNTFSSAGGNNAFGNTNTPSTSSFGFSSTPSTNSFGNSLVPVPSTSAFGGNNALSSNNMGFGGSSNLSSSNASSSGMLGGTNSFSSKPFGSSSSLSNPFESSNKPAGSQFEGNNSFGYNSAPNSNAFGSFQNTPSNNAFGSTGTPNSNSFSLDSKPMNNNTFGTGSSAFGSTPAQGTNQFGSGSSLGGNLLGSSSLGGIGGLGSSSLGSTNTLGSTGGFGFNTLGSGSTFGAGAGGVGNTTGFGGLSGSGFNSGYNTSGSILGESQNSSLINSSLRNMSGSLDDVQCTIEYLEKAYDPNSPLYKFTYVFYSLKENPGIQVQRPSNVSVEMWNQAVSMNPSPEYLYPEIVFGYEQLQYRIEKQKAVIDKLRTSREYLNERVCELKEDGIVKIGTKLAGIHEKYNSLLVEVLEHAGQAIGKEFKSDSTQYEQLEKRSHILSDRLSSLSENILRFKRRFDETAEEKTLSILEEQNRILESMLVAVKKKLPVSEHL